MSKVKQTLYNILKGKFLVDEDAKKNWGFIIFLTFLFSYAYKIFKTKDDYEDMNTLLAILRRRNK